MTPKTGAIRLATLRVFLPDGGCALSGLRSVRPAFNLFTMLAETTGLWSEPPLRSFNAIHQQLTLFSYR